MMFFKKVIKKAESIMDTAEDIDDCFFAEVMDELSDGYKEKGIYGKSIAMCAGDEAKINSIYIKLRAKSLEEEYKKIEDIKKTYRSDFAFLTESKDFSISPYIRS